MLQRSSSPRSAWGGACAVRDPQNYTGASPVMNGSALAQQSLAADWKAADLSRASSACAPVALVVVIAALADLFAEPNEGGCG